MTRCYAVGENSGNLLLDLKTEQDGVTQHSLRIEGNDSYAYHRAAMIARHWIQAGVVQMVPEIPKAEGGGK